MAAVVASLQRIEDSKEDIEGVLYTVYHREVLIWCSMGIGTEFTHSGADQEKSLSYFSESLSFFPKW